MSDFTVTFYRQWASFPHTKADRRDDSVQITVDPNGPNEGSNYEFGIEHVGTGTGRPIALRVALFSDSWRAFTDLPELFTFLASLDESGTPNASRLTVDGLAERLVQDFGWRDRTSHYERQHMHVMGCLACGQRL